MALLGMEHEDGLEYYNTTSAICDSTVGTLTMSLVKHGKIVQLNYELPSNNTVPKDDWTPKAYIKPQFRPYANVNVAVVSGNGTVLGWCQLTNGGLLRFYQNITATPQQFQGSITYITS